MLFRIVRIDRDIVRTLKYFVPLRPGLDDVAVGVHHRKAMLPFRVSAHSPLPELHAVCGILARAAGARQGRDGRVAPRQAADRVLKARPELRNQPRLRSFYIRQLTAKHQEDAVRTLGIDALAGPPRPLFIARQRADVFRPALLDFIWSK